MQYPRRLSHEVPVWVPGGARYHIRVRTDPGQPAPLTAPPLATSLLESVRFYHETHRWHCTLFLLMPDHWHALLSFPFEKRLSQVVSDWKKYHAARHDVRWQPNFFDHRLRDDRSADEKYAYILHNPVAKGLCPHPRRLALEIPQWSGLSEHASLTPALSRNQMSPQDYLPSQRAQRARSTS